MNSSNKEKVRNEVIAQMKMEPVFLDTETTGFGSDDEVVDIAIVALNGDVLLNELIKPTKAIPADANAIHGITNKMVGSAPTWEEMWPEITGALSGKNVAMYNVEFDFRLMRQSTEKHTIEWEPPNNKNIDVMHLFAEYFGNWDEYHQSFTWQKLETAGRYFNIDLPNSHRALADTLLTREVFLRMGEDV